MILPERKERPHGRAVGLSVAIHHILLIRVHRPHPSPRIARVSRSDQFKIRRILADQLGQRADGHGPPRPHKRPAVHVAAHLVGIRSQRLGGQNRDGLLHPVGLDEPVGGERPVRIIGQAQRLARFLALLDQGLDLLAHERGIEVHEHAGRQL